MAVAQQTFHPLGCVCKTHNHQWKICISNQKPPYIPMEYLRTIVLSKTYPGVYQLKHEPT